MRLQGMNFNLNSLFMISCSYNLRDFIKRLVISIGPLIDGLQTDEFFSRHLDVEGSAGPRHVSRQKRRHDAVMA